MEVGGLSRNGEGRMKRKDVGTFLFVLKHRYMEKILLIFMDLVCWIAGNRKKEGS